MGSWHNMITAPTAFPNLHQGTETSGLLFAAPARMLVDAVRVDNAPTLRSMQRLLPYWRAEWEEGKMLVTSWVDPQREDPRNPRWTRAADAEDK